MSGRLALAGVFFLAGALAVLALFVGGITELRRSEEDARRYQQIALATTELERHSLDVQAGTRGFVITGQGPFIEPLTAARAAVPRKRRELDRLATGHSQLRRDARAFGRLVEVYALGYAPESVSIARRDPAAARQRVRDGSGRRRVEAIQAAASRLTARAGALGERDKRAAATFASRAIAAGAAVLALVLVAVVLLGLYVRRAVTRPVHALVLAVHRLAAGDLATRVEERGCPEVQGLAQGLNSMASTLETGQERLDVANESREVQAAFVRVMQVARTEQEAHGILRRHIERQIPDARVSVLRDGDGALRVSSSSDARSAVGDRLAAGDGCLALRLELPHESREEGRPLLPCGVCGNLGGFRICRPISVGTTVLGAVLVLADRPFTDDERDRVVTSLALAGPVLANLRTLARAEAQALTDALTGLPNTRAVKAALTHMVAHAQRASEPLAAVVVDVDHFKRINDTYGHTSGDDVLVAIGVALSSNLRAADFVGRYGGEEFVVLLPETNVEGATVLAEKLRKAVMRLHVPGIDAVPTVSLGVAVMPMHALDGDTLLHVADRALYAAKEAGRDRVAVARDLAVIGEGRDGPGGPVAVDRAPTNGSGKGAGAARRRESAALAPGFDSP